MDQPLNVERRGVVAWLTLNRSGGANSIDAELAEALLAAAEELGGDPSVRVLVITGAGRMFCAGGDIKAFAAGADPAAAIDAITRPLHAAIERLMAMDKPLVTLVNGPAAGAGIGLAILGDIVLAAQSAHFTAAYSAIGLTPDGGTSWFLPKMIGLRRATELILTNRRLDAAEAERLGMVTRVVPDDRLVAEGAMVAEALANSAIASMGTARRLLMEGYGRGLTEHLAIEAQTIARSSAGEEGREGVAAFASRRKPTWTN